MFNIEYFHADTGETNSYYKSKKADALAMLDKFIDNGPENVKTVSASRIDFSNGDYARVVDLVPLSAMMLTREERGYYNNGSDSIFEDDL